MSRSDSDVLGSLSLNPERTLEMSSALRLALLGSFGHIDLLS